MSLFQRRASEVQNLRPPSLTLRTRNIESLNRLRRTHSVKDTSYVSPTVVWDTANFNDHYSCVRRLGKGAQASAYILSDIHLPTKQVVAKIYPDDSRNRELVTNEIKVLKHLNRNGCKPFLLCFQRNFVCPVKSVNEACKDVYTLGTPNALVVVYDYFFGQGTQDLATLLKILAYTQEDYEEMPPNERFYTSDIATHIAQPEVQLQIILTLIRCVAYLHENNVAHMDIKPANVVVNVRSGRIQLIDFGISCMESECVPLGTPTHMAPEMVRLHGKKKTILNSLGLSSSRGSSETSRVLSLENAMKADAWSIGVLLFELVHGQFPYDFSMDGLLYKIGRAQQSDIYLANFDHPNSDVSTSVSAIIDGFLNVDATKRLSVLDARDALAPLMDTVLSPSSPMASPLSPFTPSPISPGFPGEEPPF